MATVWSTLGFDQRLIDLSRISAGFTSYTFESNSDNVFHDKTYEDTYTAFFSNDGHDFKEVFSGHDITVDPDTKGPTAGIVNLLADFYWDGKNWLETSRMEGVKIKAVDLFAAIQSSDTADDLKLIANGLAGNDTLNMSKYSDYVSGFGGNDKLFGVGGDDSLFGGHGNDSVDGGVGNDSLDGGSGNDKLFGAAGNDSLIGGDGADTITGGGGADTMSGGAGADVFVFNQLQGLDHVTDFITGSDQINLSKAVYVALGAVGDLDINAFYAAAGATKGHDATDRLIYNTTNGALYYDADGSGSGKAILIASLDMHPTLAYTDVLIF